MGMYTVEFRYYQGPYAPEDWVPFLLRIEAAEDIPARVAGFISGYLGLVDEYYWPRTDAKAPALTAVADKAVQRTPQQLAEARESADLMGEPFDAVAQTGVVIDEAGEHAGSYRVLAVDKVEPDRARIAVDEDCPNCGFPELWFNRTYEVRGCNQCAYVGA